MQVMRVKEQREILEKEFQDFLNMFYGFSLPVYYLSEGFKPYWEAITGSKCHLGS